MKTSFNFLDLLESVRSKKLPQYHMTGVLVSALDFTDSPDLFSNKTQLKLKENFVKISIEIPQILKACKSNNFPILKVNYITKCIKIYFLSYMQILI